MRAVRVERFGGPEVLDVVDLPDPVPGPGQELLDVAHAGVNFADSLQAEDAYLAPTTLPLVPGVEAALAKGGIKDAIVKTWNGAA